VIEEKYSEIWPIHDLNLDNFLAVSFFHSPMLTIFCNLAVLSPCADVTNWEGVVAFFHPLIVTNPTYPLSYWFIRWTMLRRSSIPSSPPAANPF
jgi:hypothetical protein